MLDSTAICCKRPTAINVPLFHLSFGQDESTDTSQMIMNTIFRKIMFGQGHTDTIRTNIDLGLLVKRNVLVWARQHTVTNCVTTLAPLCPLKKSLLFHFWPIWRWSPWHPLESNCCAWSPLFSWRTSIINVVVNFRTTHSFCKDSSKPPAQRFFFPVLGCSHWVLISSWL